MAATIRQQIVDAIEARLKLITLGQSFTVNGAAVACRTNIGDSVSVWRTQPLADKENWLVTIQDLDAPITRGAGESEVGRHLHNLRVRVVLASKRTVRGDDAPEYNIRNMLADVMAAVGSDPRWTVAGTRLAHWTDVEETALEVDETGARMAGASLLLTVKYKTALWQM